MNIAQDIPKKSKHGIIYSILINGKKAGGDVVLIPIECVCLSACASEIMTYLNGKTFEIALFYGTTRDFKSSYKNI